MCGDASSRGIGFSISIDGENRSWIDAKFASRMTLSLNQVSGCERAVRKIAWFLNGQSHFSFENFNLGTVSISWSCQWINVPMVANLSLFLSLASNSMQFSLK